MPKYVNVRVKRTIITKHQYPETEEGVADKAISESYKMSHNDNLLDSTVKVCISQPFEPDDF